MKTLILLVHPNYGASVANKALLEAFNTGEVTLHNVCEAAKGVRSMWQPSRSS